MSFVDQSQLEKRFAELANAADQIDIAVAWVRPCKELDLLLKNRATVRIAAGISKNWTDPIALRSLVTCEHVNLRIVPDNSFGVFHPKYYCFRGQSTIQWIGSANLTRGGFGRNSELVHEFAIDSEGNNMWFEDLWSGLDTDPWPALEDYESIYIPPSRSPSKPVKKISETDLPSLIDIHSWNDFVDGLRAYDTYYRKSDLRVDVFGETHSWLHTIASRHHVIQREDWSLLSELQ